MLSSGQHFSWSGRPGRKGDGNTALTRTPLPAWRPPEDAATLWVLLAVLLAGLPHFERLPAWVGLGAGCLMAARVWMAWGGQAQPRRWLLWILAVMSFFAIVATFGRIIGRDGGVALLILMLGVKAYEIKSSRDHILILFLSYFLVITNFLVTESLPTAFYMIGVVVFITSALIGINAPAAMPLIRDRVRLSGTLLLQAAPLALVLFLLFPRLPGSLWSLPDNSRTARTGFGDTMEPGALDNLIASGDPAFRVTFEGEIPPPSERYWRGLVFWNTDGRKWTVGSPLPRYLPRVEGPVHTYTYVLTLEPHDQRWLFALDYPAAPPYLGDMAGDFHLTARDKVRSVIRYRLVSRTGGRIPISGQDERARGLILPRGPNPKARELGQTLRAQGGSDEATLNLALAFLHDGGFTYTLTPPILGRDAVDDFLFGTRRGFCEHYASALAWVMRSAGIPARVVVGFLGGEINPIGGYMLVRQSDAHAWVEVWLQAKGWVRVDPTSFVFPERLQGLESVLPGYAMPPLARFLGRTGMFGVWRGLRDVYDAVNDGWNQWVLTYGLFQQLGLLSRLGLSGLRWASTASALLMGLALALIFLLTAVLLWMERAKRRDPAQRLYLIFCRKLARLGLPRQPSEGPQDYAARVASTRPDLSASTRAITDLYIAQRYAPNASASGLTALRLAVRQFRLRW